MKDRKQNFFDIIEARSNENEEAINVLMEKNCYALIGAILRMELDSLLRAHYFNNADADEQKTILENFFDNKKWPKKDCEMLSILSTTLGWAKHIYYFCCAFIHLSPYHDWATTSDIPNLTKANRQYIVDEIRKQQNDTWGYDTTLSIEENFNFDDLIPFLPHVFKKLRGNLLCEINH